MTFVASCYLSNAYVVPGVITAVVTMAIMCGARELPFPMRYYGFVPSYPIIYRPKTNHSFVSAGSMPLDT